MRLRRTKAGLRELPSQLRELLEMIPDDAEIGSKHDARHPAIEAKVSALLEGRPMLSVVDKGEDR